MKLSERSVAAALADANIVHVVQGTGSFKATILALANYVITKLAPIAVSGSGADLTAQSVSTAKIADAAITPAQTKTKTAVALADAAATLTAAQMVDSGIFTITPTIARILTTDTAVNIVAALPRYQVGTWFDISIVNNAAFDVTLAPGVGVTLSGKTIVNDASGTWRARIDSATTITIYNIAVSKAGAGGGGTPAGTGTELQYRNAGAFGAVAGSAWDGTTLTLPGSVKAATRFVADADGTAGAPAYTFDIGGNTAYGMWYEGGLVKFSANGTYMLGVDASGIRVLGAVEGNGSQNLWGFKRQQFPLGASSTLSAAYIGTTVTNGSAGAVITTTLQSAAQGVNVKLVDNNATHRWTIKPDTGDTIIWTDGTVVSATGSIVSTARYNSFEVEALDATAYLATNVRGTWTVTA